MFRVDISPAVDVSWGVTSMGDTIAEAIDTCYEAVSKISWEDSYFRRDIGRKALDR